MADEMKEPLPTDILEEIDNNQEEKPEEKPVEETKPVVASSMEELHRLVNK